MLSQHKASGTQKLQIKESKMKNTKVVAKYQQNSRSSFSQLLSSEKQALACLVFQHLEPRKTQFLLSSNPSCMCSTVFELNLYYCLLSGKGNMYCKLKSRHYTLVLLSKDHFCTLFNTAISQLHLFEKTVTPKI